MQPNTSSAGIVPEGSVPRDVESPDPSQALIATLDSSDPVQRFEAMYRLARLPEPADMASYISALAPKLIALSAYERDRQTRMEAAVMLERLGHSSSKLNFGDAPVYLDAKLATEEREQTSAEYYARWFKEYTNGARILPVAEYSRITKVALLDMTHSADSRHRAFAVAALELMPPSLNVESIPSDVTAIRPFLAQALEDVDSDLQIFFSATGSKLSAPAHFAPFKAGESAPRPKAARVRKSKQAPITSPGKEPPPDADQLTESTEPLLPSVEVPKILVITPAFLELENSLLNAARSPRRSVDERCEALQRLGSIGTERMRQALKGLAESVLSEGAGIKFQNAAQREGYLRGVARIHDTALAADRAIINHEREREILDSLAPPQTVDRERDLSNPRSWNLKLRRAFSELYRIGSADSVAVLSVFGSAQPPYNGWSLRLPAEDYDFLKTRATRIAIMLSAPAAEERGRLRATTASES